MKTRIQVQSIPDADPISGQIVLMRAIDDGTTLDSATTDADGLALFLRNGHPRPYYLYVSGMPGGDKFWRSDEVMTAGPTSPWDWPTAMIPLGNGVVDGYSSELAVSVNGTTLTIAPGGALVVGHPFVQYMTFTQILTRPVSGTRTDRAIIRLYPGESATTPGKADLVILAGADTIGTVPGLTQSATVYELPLARITVPSAGTLSVDDERQMLHPERHAPATDQAVAAGPLVTSSAGGEALSGMSVTLSLPDEGTYDIIGRLTSAQVGVAGSTDWTPLDTYGPTFNGIAMSDPRQVAVDSTGRILIADTGNNRLVRLTSAGAYDTSITGLVSITGVAVNPTGGAFPDYVFVAYGSSGSYYVRCYNASLVLQWTSPVMTTRARHLAGGFSYLYSTQDDNTIRKWIVSSGGLTATFGGTGTGDGQFTTPYGIAYNDTNQFLHIVDQGNSRVQVLNTSGVYQRQWAISANARGIAAFADGRVAVAEYGLDLINRYTTHGVFVDAFPQADPDGVSVASGDVVWVSNNGAGTSTKWDEVTTEAGHGQVAVEIDGVVGTYVGPGNRDASMRTVATGSKAGGFGSTVTVRGFGKAVSGSATFKSLVLSAEARPRR